MSTSRGGYYQRKDPEAVKKNVEAILANLAALRKSRENSSMTVPEHLSGEREVNPAPVPSPVKEEITPAPVTLPVPTIDAHETVPVGDSNPYSHPGNVAQSPSVTGNSRIHTFFILAGLVCMVFGVGGVWLKLTAPQPLYLHLMHNHVPPPPHGLASSTAKAPLTMEGESKDKPMQPEDGPQCFANQSTAGFGQSKRKSHKKEEFASNRTCVKPEDTYAPYKQQEQTPTFAIPTTVASNNTCTFQTLEGDKFVGSFPGYTWNISLNQGCPACPSTECKCPSVKFKYPSVECIKDVNITDTMYDTHTHSFKRWGFHAHCWGMWFRMPLEDRDRLLQLEPRLKRECILQIRPGCYIYP